MGNCGMGISSDKNKDSLRKAQINDAVKKREKEIRDKKIIKK